MAVLGFVYDMTWRVGRPVETVILAPLLVFFKEGTQCVVRGPPRRTNIVQSSVLGAHGAQKQQSKEGLHLGCANQFVAGAVLINPLAHSQACVRTCRWQFSESTPHYIDR